MGLGHQSHDRQEHLNPFPTELSKEKSKYLDI